MTGGCSAPGCNFPFMLPGMRSTWKQGSDSSPAEAIYGTLLHLPGQFVPGVEAPERSPDSFADDLQRRMRAIAAAPSVHHDSRTRAYVPRALFDADKVYICHDFHRKPLQRPYNGPFKVLQRQAELFTIEKGGSPYTVSVDGLKPALETVSDRDRISLPFIFDPDDFPPLPTVCTGRISRPPIRL